MPIAKHLIVENGVLKVTDKARPDSPPEMSNFTNPVNLALYREWKKKDESWKQEALVLDSYLKSDKIFNWLRANGLKEGVYDAPAGLEYEVKEEIDPYVDPFGSWTMEVAILSFASPKEETLNCNHNFVTRVDGRMVCSFCGTIAFIDFASPEETPASKEKPDFEKLYNELGTKYDFELERWMERDVQQRAEIESLGNQVVSLGKVLLKPNEREVYDKQIAALQEEIRQLKNKK